VLGAAWAGMRRPPDAFLPWSNFKSSGSPQTLSLVANKKTSMIRAPENPRTAQNTAEAEYRNAPRSLRLSTHLRAIRPGPALQMASFAAQRCSVSRVGGPRMTGCAQGVVSVKCCVGVPPLCVPLCPCCPRSPLAGSHAFITTANCTLPAPLTSGFSLVCRHPGSCRHPGPRGAPPAWCGPWIRGRLCCTASTTSSTTHRSS
jgi:hypothetical protein